MRYCLTNEWYRGFLKDEDIKTGCDYLYCPLNQPPKRVRITGYAFGNTGIPIVFYWHEVRADGSLSIEADGTLGLFRPLMEPLTFELKVDLPLTALQGVYTAQLRRPKEQERFAECQC